LRRYGIYERKWRGLTRGPRHRLNNPTNARRRGSVLEYFTRKAGSCPEKIGSLSNYPGDLLRVPPAPRFVFRMHTRTLLHASERLGGSRDARLSNFSLFFNRSRERRIRINILPVS